MRTWYAAAVSASVGVMIGWAVQDPIARLVVVTLSAVVLISTLIIGTFMSVWRWLGRRAIDTLVDEALERRDALVQPTAGTVDKKEDEQRCWDEAVAFYGRAEHAVHRYADRFHPKLKAWRRVVQAYSGVPRHRWRVLSAYDAWLSVLTDIRANL
jgi:hypothetical protein